MIWRLATLWLLAQVVTVGADDRSTAPGRRSGDRGRLDATFNRELELAAKQCTTTNPNLAAQLRFLKVQHDSTRTYVFVNRHQPDTEPFELGFSDDDTVLKNRVHSLRRHLANHLLADAKQHLDSGNDSAAFRTLHEVVFHDPKNATASKMLSVNRTPVSARRGRSTQPKFGWAPATYWRIKSPHFAITTNASEEAGRSLARQLEGLHASWRQVFFDYWANGELLSTAWKRKAPLPSGSKTYRVVLFANRDDYTAYLKKIEPLAQMTLGYYSANAETAYFFADATNDRSSTWLHEATHQLFHESKRVHGQVGRDDNFWLIEGLALYMESLQNLGPCLSVGGLESERLQFARFRCLAGDFYQPLEQFVARGQTDIQQDENIRKVYSQAAGLTHFFMHGNDGALRKPFLQYVSAVYSGRSSPSTLAASIGKSYVALDAMYQKFLSVTDSHLLELDTRAKLRSLSLGNTQVSDRGLANIRFDSLAWLDLNNTSVTDASFANLQNARSLRQLSLENTNVGDATVAQLRNMRLIQELDLSGTQVTDAAVDSLVDLKSLTIIWLGRTQMSATALARIKTSLPNLEHEGR